MIRRSEKAETRRRVSAMLSMNRAGAWFEKPAPPFSHPICMLPLKSLFHICAPGLLVFFSFCLATAGEISPQQSAPSPHPGETQPAQSQTPSSPTPSAEEEAEDRARASFDVFTRKWMQKLARTEDFLKKRMQIRQTQEGFVAEYTGYLPYRYTKIKQTQSKATPFIGILTYYKKTMRSVGKTEKQATNGLFEHAETSQVSEIFPYTKGEWVY